MRGHPDVGVYFGAHTYSYSRGDPGDHLPVLFLMKAMITRTALFLLAAFFLLCACGSTAPDAPAAPASSAYPTIRSSPTAIATLTVEIAATPALSPTVEPGRLADFYAFAGDIAAAIQARNSSFFAEHVSSPDWNCMGDETAGVCIGHQAGAVLHGMPVTRDWSMYKLYSASDYKAAWQAAYESGDVLKLVGVANQAGDNPLMPGADQSFMAVIAVSAKASPMALHDVRVLYFEYAGQSWQLDGQLMTVGQAQDWVSGTCAACYDTWMAWPN